MRLGKRHVKCRNYTLDVFKTHRTVLEPDGAGQNNCSLLKRLQPLHLGCYSRKLQVETTRSTLGRRQQTRTRINRCLSTCFNHGFCCRSLKLGRDVRGSRDEPTVAGHEAMQHQTHDAERNTGTTRSRLNRKLGVTSLGRLVHVLHPITALLSSCFQSGSAAAACKVARTQ